MLALLMTMVATPATAELPDILESGKIRIAVPENFPPFGSLGEEGCLLYTSPSPRDP